jgi:four helix bundle protein
MSIALKEANETEYWIFILKDIDFINDKLYTDISTRLKELIIMLISTVKTAKKTEPSKRHNKNTV